MEAGEAGAYGMAGVNIDAGNRAVELMRGAVRSTFVPNVLADVGYFGGLFALDPDSSNGPVLVASADGVGTKLKFAFALGTHRLIGQDIVNHCINDILACGARPLFFLDYLATGKLVPEQSAEIVAGMAEACRAAGCALLGGETAEMPGMYAAGEYDVAGFIVGMVQRDRLVQGIEIAPGDLVLGLPSNGLHTNGYSLVRKALGLEGDTGEMREKLGRHEEGLDGTLGEVLTRPHTSYLPEIKPLLDLPARPIKGMAHITGGGIQENVPRMLPANCAVEINTDAWQAPAIFRLIQERGNIAPGEMFRVFNMGIGMVLIVARQDAEAVRSKLPQALEIGRVVQSAGEQRVILKAEG